MNDGRNEPTGTEEYETGPARSPESARIYDGRSWRTAARTEFDRSEGPELGTTIAYAIAEAADTPPESLDPPLYECVDAEHLGRALFYVGRDDAVAASARFRYRDYLVTVRGDGTILIAEPVADATGPDAA